MQRKFGQTISVGIANKPSEAPDYIDEEPEIEHLLSVIHCEEI